MITKKEMKYWLDDNYQNWIADVLINLINENKPNALVELKKEIKQAYKDSVQANEQAERII